MNANSPLEAPSFRVGRLQFTAVDDFYQSIKTLTKFKQDMKELGEVTVVDTIESNYDFLFNSMIEKANQERKHK